MTDIQSFRHAVEAFIAARGWTPTRFGRAIAGDPLFVFDLREGREPRSDTRTRILKAMQEHEEDSQLGPLRLGIAGLGNVGATLVKIVQRDGDALEELFTRTRAVRPMVRLNVSIIVEENGRRESGSAGGGGRIGLTGLLTPDHWQALAREALRIAVVNLSAEAAPAGVMDVVLGPGWPGILLHEAVGHGLEGDFNRKKQSAFAGLMGQRVAAPGVTVLDDGTIPDRRGSITVDDEGTPSAKNVLIEDGILVGYMQDRQSARLMGVAPSPGRDGAAKLFRQVLQCVVKRHAGNIGAGFLDGRGLHVAPVRGAVNIAIHALDENGLQPLKLWRERPKFILNQPLLQGAHPGGVDQWFRQMLVHFAIPRRQQVQRFAALRLYRAGGGGLAGEPQFPSDQRQQCARGL